MWIADRDWTGPSWRQGRSSRQKKRRIRSGMLRMPLAPLGYSKPRNYKRLLICPLRRSRRPLLPARTRGQRPMAVTETKSEVEEIVRMKRV